MFGLNLSGIQAKLMYNQILLDKIGEFHIYEQYKTPVRIVKKHCIQSDAQNKDVKNACLIHCYLLILMINFYSCIY